MYTYCIYGYKSFHPSPPRFLNNRNTKFQMAKRKSTTAKPGCAFKRVIIAARSETWLQLVVEIDNWIYSNEARHSGCNGFLTAGYSDALLSVVVLESGVEVVEKINGLVIKFGARVEPTEFLVSHKSLLMKAVFNMNSDAAVALLVHGADPNKIHNVWGGNAYVFAAENNMVNVFKTMTMYKANLYQMNPYGENALVVAVRYGNLEIAEYILKQGMSPDWFTFTDHMTLLHWAVENRTVSSTPMIKFLLDQGANPHIRSFRPAGFGWDTPGTGFTPLEFLMAQAKGVSRYKAFTADEMVVVIANANLLSAKMQKDVTERQLAFCMTSIERLSSKSECMVATLSGEPSLLKMIMDKAVGEFDIDYAANPLLPTIEYTGVVDGY